MRFLHCADLHIGCLGEEEECNSLSLLAEAALAGEAQAVLIVGDLFDKAASYPHAAQRVAEPLSRLARRGVEVFAVEGNHDCGIKGPLRYIEKEGLVRVLRPKWGASGKPVLSDCVVECHNVRIAGLGFLGERTAPRLMAFVDALSEYSGPTVLMLHTGVYGEGQMPPGGITQSDIERCAKKIQYIALGHRHGREEHGFAYNPGSPSGVRIHKPDADYGYYLVDIGAGFSSISFFSTRNR